MADATGAVRRTPRPAWGEDRQAVGTAAQLGRHATNPGHPVSPDSGNGSGDLRADLVERLFKVLEPRLLEHLEVQKGDLPGWAAVQHTARWDAEAVADALLDDGWRPQSGAVVDDFCAERAEYITAINNCHPDNDRDYWRWNGHAEARRQLSERLGLPTAWPTEVPS